VRSAKYRFWGSSGVCGPACALLVLAGSLGCGETLRVEQAEQGEKVDVDTLLHDHLQKQPMVTAAEAYRAMLILADGEEKYDSFEARRQSLEERGIARPQWGLSRDACIDKGSVAYMVCKILKIRGGVNFAVFGQLGIGDRRYAVRELASMDMMPQTAAYRYITGGELVDLMLKADRYMAEHGAYEEESVDIGQMLETPGERK